MLMGTIEGLREEGAQGEETHILMVCLLGFLWLCMALYTI